METHARASDGRRRFTAEFKREQMSRVSRGEVTLAELSREIDVSPSVVRRWKVPDELAAETHGFLDVLRVP